MELLFFLIWLKISVFTSYFTKSTIINRKQPTYSLVFFILTEKVLFKIVEQDILN